MYSITTRKTPLILFVPGEQLTADDIHGILYLDKVKNPVNYVLSSRHVDEIIINADLPEHEEIAERVRAIMDAPMTMTANAQDRLFEAFRELVPDNTAFSSLCRIWSDWRDEREQAENYKKAKEILKQVSKKKYRKAPMKHWGVANEVDKIASGHYEKGKYEPKEGIKAVFVYGYLLGREELFCKKPKADNEQLADFFLHLQDKGIAEYWKTFIFLKSASELSKMPERYQSDIFNMRYDYEMRKEQEAAEKDTRTDAERKEEKDRLTVCNQIVHSLYDMTDCSQVDFMKRLFDTVKDCTNKGKQDLMIATLESYLKNEANL